MASGKKSAKGNKTAHVLNLLTAPGGGASAPAEEAQESASSPEAVQPVPGRPLVPPILEVAQANDENLAQQIQQALEEELLPDEPASALPEPAPVPEPPVPPRPEEAEPVQTGDMPVPTAPPPASPSASPAPEAAPDLEAALAQALEAELLSENSPQSPSTPAPEDSFEETVFPDLSQPESPADEEPPAAELPASREELPAEELPAPREELPPSPAPQPEEIPAAPESQPESPAPPETPAQTEASAEPAPQPPEPADELGYINVIQSLVEEKAPRYIQMFGLCPCPRCKIDVVALTLNNLVPKYVVMKKHDMIPMLTVYEGRFSSTIFAQLTRACKIVLDHPRHTPEDLARIEK